MGVYLQVPEMKQKAEQLIRLHQAQLTLHPLDIREVPPWRTLVCVVENPSFDAAGIVHSQREMEAFAHPDGRPKTWLLIDTSEVLRMDPSLKKYLRADGTWNLER